MPAGSVFGFTGVGHSSAIRSGLRGAHATASTVTTTHIFLSSSITGSAMEERTTSQSISTTTALLFDTILRGNSTAAGELVGTLMEVRGTPRMDELLDDLLPPESFPLWTRIPFAAKFSKRARQRDLKKVLDLSTPSVDNDTKEEGDLDDDPESMKRRSRRALFILLRNLASNDDDDDSSSFRDASITRVKRIASKDAKQQAVSSADMLKRTPQGLETPQYEVLASRPNKGIEVRRYDEFAVCSVTMGDLKSESDETKTAQQAKLSNPQLSGATSFGALAGYLFGKNQEQKVMKMTTPVFSVGNGDARTMSFVLPSDYWQGDEAIGTAPKPLDGSAVKLTTDEGGVRAVLMFGGFGRKADVAVKSNQLLDVLSRDKEWEAVADQPVTLAQYNDPFTPPWKRRNEVSVPVVSR